MVYLEVKNEKGQVCSPLSLFPGFSLTASTEGNTRGPRFLYGVGRGEEIFSTGDIREGWTEEFLPDVVWGKA